MRSSSTWTTIVAGAVLFAVVSTNLDAIVADPTAGVTWSGDGGLTWSPPSGKLGLSGFGFNGQSLHE